MDPHLYERREERRRGRSQDAAPEGQEDLFAALTTPAPSVRRPLAPAAPQAQSHAVLEGRAARDQAAAAHEGVIALLIPVAQELAERAGPGGITVADLRETAMQRGLIPPSGSGRELSYLGAVLRRAGLKATGERRRSHLEQTHGNLNMTYVAPRWATERGTL